MSLLSCISQSFYLHYPKNPNSLIFNKLCRIPVTYVLNKLWPQSSKITFVFFKNYFAYVTHTKTKSNLI